MIGLRLETHGRLRALNMSSLSISMVSIALSRLVCIVLIMFQVRLSGSTAASLNGLDLRYSQSNKLIPCCTIQYNAKH